MITRLLDKLLFGAALLFALQIPLFVDHYQQFLSGLFESTKWQIEGYEANARKYEYPSVQAMISHHLQNDVLSVREDARQKLETVQLFDTLKEGIELFEQGNLLEKLVFMLNPSRYHYLEKTAKHYKLGIPLTLSGFLFGVALGFVIYYAFAAPFLIFTSLRRRRIAPS